MFASQELKPLLLNSSPHLDASILAYVVGGVGGNEQQKPFSKATRTVAGPVEMKRTQWQQRLESIWKGKVCGWSTMQRIHYVI